MNIMDVNSIGKNVDKLSISLYRVLQDLPVILRLTAELCLVQIYDE